MGDSNNGHQRGKINLDNLSWLFSTVGHDFHFSHNYSLSFKFKNQRISVQSTVPLMHITPQRSYASQLVVNLQLFPSENLQPVRLQFGIVKGHVCTEHKWETVTTAIKGVKLTWTICLGFFLQLAMTSTFPTTIPFLLTSLPPKCECPLPNKFLHMYICSNFFKWFIRS